MNLPNKISSILAPLFISAACIGIALTLRTNSLAAGSVNTAPIIQHRAKAMAAAIEHSEMVEVVAEEINEPPTETVAPTVQPTPRGSNTNSTLDRTKPLYNVFKGGFRVQVPVELQWYIRDMCETYQFYEKYVYGMILCESTFQPTVSNGSCIGLCQINKFWIGKAAIKHFTDDYASRNLKDPYDNLLTLAEMWCYARDAYDLDLMTEMGMLKVCYWHNTGKDPRHITSSGYFRMVAKYANELVPLQ